MTGASAGYRPQLSILDDVVCPAHGQVPVSGHKRVIITDPLSLFWAVSSRNSEFSRSVLPVATMSLTLQEIDRIAHLARLELKNEESERMLTSINGFFGIVEAMRVVNTDGIEPLAHPVAAFREVQLRLREDQVTEPDQRDANQRSAPAVEQGLFLVPKVIE